MFEDQRVDRRTVIAGAGSVMFVGALAGCGTDEGTDGDEEGLAGNDTDGEEGVAGNETDGAMDENETDGAVDENETDGAVDENETDGVVDENETDGAADGNQTDGTDGAAGDVQEVDEFLSDTENYEQIQDMTGQGEVTVEVGAQGNGGAFAFEPAAIQVDQGTNVVWEWTGEGGGHNVVHQDGEFESEITDEAGFTFEHAFEESGTYLYVCEPHESLGMKGAVVVQ